MFFFLLPTWQHIHTSQNCNRQRDLWQLENDDHNDDERKTCEEENIWLREWWQMEKIVFIYICRRQRKQEKNDREKKKRIGPCHCLPIHHYSSFAFSYNHLFLLYPFGNPDKLINCCRWRWKDDVDVYNCNRVCGANDERVLSTLQYLIKCQWNMNGIYILIWANKRCGPFFSSFPCRLSFFCVSLCNLCLITILINHITFKRKCTTFIWTRI